MSAPTEAASLDRGAVPAAMQGLVYDRYGSADVLQIRRVRIPAPGRGEILVRVRAAALNPKDVLVRKGRFRLLSGPRFPKQVGCDWAGEVARTGPGVLSYTVGDRVFGALSGWSGRRGSLAQYLVARTAECARMPAALSFEEAAAIPLAAQTALQALRDLARVRAGDHVGINGASGGVGVFAIQIAKALGASVTSVSSARNLDFCRRLGADEALDYAAEDPFSGSRSYRVVLDAFGNRRFEQVRASLGPGGVFVTTVPSWRIVVDALRTIVGYPRARLVAVRSRAADLDVLAQLVDAGRLRAVIDRVVDFDAVVDAIRFLESRRARGKVVVRMP